MELLKLSKFKLQLHALITEVRDLRERERFAFERHQHLIENQKQTQEECNRKIQELQTELASLQEERQKLDWRMNYLLNDNALLESKQKELKGTVDGLLQSRDNFMHVYEVGKTGSKLEQQESTYEMRRSLEIKDRKLNVLSEKINSHLLLFDSIEKEVSSIKQIMDKVQSLVNEKEELVTALKNKLDGVSTIETTLVENISNLRNKLEANEGELRKKDKLISELEAKLDAAKFSDNSQARIEDLQKTLSVKDVEMQNLITDKEALHYEVGSLRLIFQRIQDTMANMNEEDKSLFSSILQHKEACPRDMSVEDNRIEDMIQNNEEKVQELLGSPI